MIKSCLNGKLLCFFDVYTLLPGREQRLIDSLIFLNRRFKQATFIN